jgi:hypothetical protein
MVAKIESRDSEIERIQLNLAPPDCDDVLSRTQAVPTHQITGARSRK